MKLRKIAIIYSALFTASAVWLLLTFSNGSNGVAPPARFLTDRNPGAPPTTPIVGRNPSSPSATNNHTYSNVNAFGNPRDGSSRVYPVLEPHAPISQTVNGYTVTLYLAHADENRVVFTYTVQSAFQDLRTISSCDPLVGQDPPCYVSGETLIGPGGVVLETPPPTPTSGPYYEPKLTTDDGRVLPWSHDMAWHAEDNLSARLDFDTQLPPEALPDNLKLHLKFNVAQFFFLDSYTGGLYSRSIVEPFAFDFSLLIDPLRRIATVNQTSTTPEGNMITIEKVIATTHSIRVLWRVDDLAQSQPTLGWYACCSLKLEVGGTSVPFSYSYPNPLSPTQSPERESVADASLLDEQGDWIISASYFSTYMGNAYYPPIPGPTFHFTMPPPTR